MDDPATVALAAGGVAALGLAYYLMKPPAPRFPQLPVRRWAADELSVYPGKGKYYATEPAAEATVRVGRTGLAGEKPVTVFDVFKQAVARHGAREALRYEVSNGQWRAYTWQQYYDESINFARALLKIGFEPAQSVNVIGFNSPEWFFANLGAIAAGGKAAGIYTTNEPDACRYIAEHSEAVVAVVENEAQLRKFLLIRDQLPRLRAIVMWTGDVPGGANVPGKTPVYKYRDFVALGADVPVGDVERRIQAQRPGHCCTLIYTSGTTGPPKAVMCSHDNLTWTCKSVLEIVKILGFGDDNEHIISYLPLSHIAAQMVDIHMPIALSAANAGFGTVWFARPDALRGSLPETLRAARPTLFFGVPRVWEKIVERMREVGAQSTGLKKKIAMWAKAKGLEGYRAMQVGGPGSLPAGYGLADRLVFSKVRAQLGLDRARVLLTGAAPISRETLEFLGALGITVCELYGMSESTGPQTVSYPTTYKCGSCGPVMPGAELRIDHQPGRDKPGHGEILFRGRHIMMGYMKNEDKSRETIDPDGWLHSGDVGHVDEDGMLFITGRIKELIIGAGGENIAPVPNEDAFKEVCPAISNVMMVGDRRKYNVALVTLRCEPRDDGSFTNMLAPAALAVSPASKTLDDALRDPVWRTYLDEGLRKVNQRAVSNAARIQKYIIVPDFSVAGNELTPTLKLKRSVVADKYAKEIDALYQGGGD